MKQRTVRFHVKTPEIQIAYSTPDTDYELKFPFKRKNIEGTIALKLDSSAFGDWTPTNDPEGPEYVASTCEAIIVQVEGQSDDVFEDESFLQIAHRLTVEHLNKLISFIAIELGQYWVHLGRLSEWEFKYFLNQTEAKWIDGKSEISVFEAKSFWEMLEVFEGAPQPSEFYDRALSINKARWKSIYLYFLHEGFQPDLVKSLMTNAKRYFENGDYQMAAVQAVTALDVKVEPFVAGRCQQKGISKEKFKETNHFIAEYLKVFLPLVLQENELEDWIHKKSAHSANPTNVSNWTAESILAKCIAINKIRNDVAHRGKFEQSDISLVRQGIEAVELLLEFIEGSEDSLSSKETTSRDQ